MNTTEAQKDPGLMRLIKQLGALAVAISTILTLIFILWPEIKPEPSKALRATISDLALERGVSLMDYLARTHKPSTLFTDEQLELAGTVVHFNIEIEGFKGRQCLLDWTLYDAETNVRVPVDWVFTDNKWGFKPEAPVDRAGAEVWVPPQTSERTYYVRLELFDDKDVRLAFADSQPFGANP